MQTGDSVGPYRILAKVGQGGMGEVYRARDTKLDRDVALKILPEFFAADPDRLMRFEREAKTLAALNHPHIAQIYGIEDSAATRALVMELVPGEDLASVIARGKLAVDEALAIARQIAEAVEAAHEAGVIHRDLKPANVKLRPDGTVKVLDFGLAKALTPGVEPGNGLEAPAAHGHLATVTSPALTQIGLILGTAAYMAPEQARGKAVDRRADIWAFGCVLFEMLAGRRPFAGDNTTDVLAAIVTRDPEWTALPGTVPEPVKQLLRRCLDRDPRERLRDIGEARVLLERPAAANAPAVSGPQRGKPRMAVALLVIAAAVAAGYALAFATRPPAGSGSGLLQTAFRQITEQPGLERQPTVSPDGKTVVYVSERRGKSDLYSMRVGGRNSILLTDESRDDDYAPAFSPDGNRIAFRSDRAGGGIFVMEATGESVRRISDFGFDPQWSPDGTQLAVADERVYDPMSRSGDSHIWTIRVSDGAKHLVSEADGVGPHWSPDGKRIVFWGVRNNRRSERDLFSARADGSEAKSPVSLTDDAPVDWSPVWSPDGRFVYFASSRGGTMNLWRIAVDQSSGQPQGSPEPLTTPTAWSGDFEVSADGHTLVYSDLDERSAIHVAAFDPASGKVTSPLRQVHQGRAINSIHVAADGRTLVFSQRGQPWEALGTIRIDGTGWSRISDDDFYHRLPSWSPDGSRVLFYTNSSRGRLWTSRPDGSEVTEVRLPDDLSAGVYPVWSADGKQIVAAFAGGVAVLDLASSPARVTLRFPPDIDFRPFSWSSDGRWVAGAARYAMRDQLVLLDLQERKRRVIADNGSSPAWLPDGKRLLFSSPTHLTLLDVTTGTMQEVVPLPRQYDSWGRTVSLSHDGRTLAYLQSQSEGDVWMMTLSPGSTAARRP